MSEFREDLEKLPGPGETKTDLDDHLLFLPIEVATTPLPGESHHISNAWWAVHPEKGIVLYLRVPKSRYCTPQFNSDKLITDYLTRKLYPFAETRQIEHVYLRYSDDNGFLIPEGASS